MPYISSVLGAILLIILSVRIARIWRSERHEAFVYIAFLLLYAVMTYQRIRWQDAPQDVIWTVRIFLGAGILFFFPGLMAEIFSRRWRRHKNIEALKKQKGPFAELIKGCRALSQARMGALILIERKSRLHEWFEKGSPVDALLTSDLLQSIFTPPGDLHDGAVLVQDDRIVAAGIIVPLTKSSIFPKSLGTRHRAAVGLSEVCDALCVIVSEETGALSIADRGFLYYSIPANSFASWLYRGMKFKLPRDQDQFLIVSEKDHSEASAPGGAGW
ncbi:MAG: DNA integrity scanning protein DisA nucleotide-binding domain protein [Candidatus Omnitrophica bacterium]|nr:DNA integrity scanning protein DisA nucleotide-binding domain protein [Candidatus Omnitrophota bacterium]